MPVAKNVHTTCERLRAVLNSQENSGKKRDTFKNCPLLKNWYFLSYLVYETWWKLSLHQVTLFTMFNGDRTKNVDYLLIANFWTCLVFSSPDFTIEHDVSIFTTLL